MRQYIPLVSGILMPLSTFLNLQSITVPGFSYEDRRNGSNPYGNNPLCRPFALTTRNIPGFVVLNPHHQNTPTYSKIVLLLSLLSFIFGLLGTIALFVRMLERKIKWMTRLIIVGSWCQGVFGLIALSCLLSPTKIDSRNRVLIFTSGVIDAMSEGIFFNLSAVLLSLCVAVSFTYHHVTNQYSVYSYTLHDLSLSQRQLILLTISSLVYMSSVSGLYGWLEGWDFDNAIYWCIATFTTIGFGDFAPITPLGRSLIPIVTFFGIGLVGGNIWSLRNVLLELITLQLAHQYSKKFGITTEDRQWIVERAMESGSIPGARLDPAEHHSRQQQDKPEYGSHRHLLNTHTHRQHLTNSKPGSPQLGPRRRAHSFDETLPDKSWLAESLAAAGASRANQSHSKIDNDHDDEHRPLLEAQHLHGSNTKGKCAHRVLEDDTFLPSIGMLASHKAGEKTFRDIEALQIEQQQSRDQEPREIFLKNPNYARTFTYSEGDHPVTSSFTSNGSFSPHMNRDRFVPPPHDYRREVTISRSRFLPDVTIIADSTLRKRQIVETTQQTLQFQLTLSIVLVLITIIAFGAVFAWLEQWSWWEGMYFAYCSAATIGYGDLSLCSFAGRSIFVWFIFFAILSWTYLGSMVAEIALDQWTVTVDHIEKRVDRYERKAKLKKLYGKKSKYAAESKSKAFDIKKRIPSVRHTDPIKPLDGNYANVSFLDLDEESTGYDEHRTSPLQHTVSGYSKTNSSGSISDEESCSSEESRDQEIEQPSSSAGNQAVPDRPIASENVYSSSYTRGETVQPSMSYLTRRSTHALLSGRPHFQSFHPRHSRSFSSVGTDETYSTHRQYTTGGLYGTMRSIPSRETMREAGAHRSFSLPPASADDEQRARNSDSASIIRVRLPNQPPQLFPFGRLSDPRQFIPGFTFQRDRADYQSDRRRRWSTNPNTPQPTSSRPIRVQFSDNSHIHAGSHFPLSSSHPHTSRSPEHDAENEHVDLERVPLLTSSCPDIPSPLSGPMPVAPNATLSPLDLDEVETD